MGFRKKSALAFVVNREIISNLPNLSCNFGFEARKIHKTIFFYYIRHFQDSYQNYKSLCGGIEKGVHCTLVQSLELLS